MYRSRLRPAPFSFLRCGVLVEQLARGGRRLTGDVLHRDALPEIGGVVRRGQALRDGQIAHEAVVDHQALGAARAAPYEGCCRQSLRTGKTDGFMV